MKIVTRHDISSLESGPVNNLLRMPLQFLFPAIFDWKLIFVLMQMFELKSFMKITGKHKVDCKIKKHFKMLVDMKNYQTKKKVKKVNKQSRF